MKGTDPTGMGSFLLGHWVTSGDYSYCGIPDHAFRTCLRDRSDAYLFCDDLVPLCVRCGFRGIARLGIGWCRCAPPQTVVDSDDRKSGASPDVLRGSNCGLSLGHCGVSVPAGTPSPLFCRATGSVLFCRNGAVDDLPFEPGDRLDTLLRRSDRCIARCVARDGSSGMGRFRVHAFARRSGTACSFRFSFEAISNRCGLGGFDRRRFCSIERTDASLPRHTRHA